MPSAGRPPQHKFRVVGGRPLWCAFRTQGGHRVRSEKCHERKSPYLFSHAVNEREKLRGDRQPKRFGRLHVESQFEFGELLNWEVGELLLRPTEVVQKQRAPGGGF